VNRNEDKCIAMLVFMRGKKWTRTGQMKNDLLKMT